MKPETFIGTCAAVIFLCVLVLGVLTCRSIAEAPPTNLEATEPPCMTGYPGKMSGGVYLHRVCDRSNGTMMYLWNGKFQVVPYGCRSWKRCMEEK